ncbi:hypothetical protein DLM45_08870 [Hyphomicrobium methylovorum]|uniref:response regulator n=1 Tax=Hyphomicrobium methylovorum TaxID=84 RepID=UPI0015E69897|nr:response regulator [Hyphomicrobium methylovorum]MBA2126335.1 hypothetical protein [Hyphomicrobium methylovorum]
MAVSKAKVLVVEDEFLIRWDLVAALEDAGFSTVEAGSAAEAISVLERDRDIRVVFTDIQMPGSMDGLALANYVRGRWPPTIIVISSAIPFSKMQGVPSGVGMLPKPLDRSALKSLLSRIEHQLGS